MKAEKRIVVTILMLMTVVVVVAQDGSRAFGEVSLAANNAGMYVLGG